MKRGLLLVIMFTVLACFTVSAVDGLNVSLSDQGSGVKNSTGSVLASGSLGVSIWDNLTGGTMIYNESFATAIVNGSWSVMLGENGSNNLTLEYGTKYYKDYVIAGEDADFTDYTGTVVERQFFFSPLGHVATEDLTAIADFNIAKNLTAGNLTSNAYVRGVDALLSGNLTLGQKITFALAETIDNIVNGWITVTGNLNVTEAISVGPLRLGGAADPSLNQSDTSMNLTIRVGENTTVLTKEGDLYVNKSLYIGGGISFDDDSATLAVPTGFILNENGLQYSFNSGQMTFPSNGIAVLAGLQQLNGETNLSFQNTSGDYTAIITEQGNMYLNNTLYFGPSGSIAESGDIVTIMAGSTALTFDTNGILTPGSGSTIKANQWDYNEGNMTIRNTTQVTNVLFTDAGKFLFGLNNPNPRVGIGVSTPGGDIDTANLVVNGNMRLMASSYVPCSTANAGLLYFNSTNFNFYGCNSTNWVQLNGNVTG